MTSHRYAERALALSLSLTAAGAFCVLGPASAVGAPRSPVTSTVGGGQLAAPGVIVNLKPGVPPPPAMPAPSFVLADLDTGEILVAKAPHAPHAPASTLKTLTALTLMPILHSNSQIRVKPEDVNVQGTHLGILPGTAYSVATLMQGMLITSGNDAAYALARGNTSVAVTLKAMNETAARLGAADTVAKDPSGLDAVGQQSSAYDLALIGRAGMKLPDFRRYVGTKQVSLPGGRALDGSMKPGFKIGNHNRLLFNYPGAIGIKNGYTIAAKFSYVQAATRGGKSYLVTEMATDKSDWRSAASMLDWAFAHGTSVAPVGQLVERGQSGPSQRSEPPSTSTATVSPPAASKTPSSVAAAGLPKLPLATPPHESARRRAAWAWAGAAGGVSALMVGAVFWLVGRKPSRPRR
ncbi:MAG: hypothetical protein QOF35_1216 [Actinomycetota bacterium]|nr:hypothetical protein [Actinomycetota bacterium]